MEGYASAEEAKADPDFSEEHFRLYYDRDKALAATAPRLLPALCAAYDFDLILLDGSEYTSRAEFNVVESLCRLHFLALHDCSTLNMRAVVAHLAARPLEWRRVSNGTDNAAWAVYENLLFRVPPSPIRILSTDYHIGPIAEVKHYLATTFPGAATVTDLSLSSHCEGNCATADQLAVLKPSDNEGMYATSGLQRRLFSAYANGGLPFEHDLFHCSHPTGMCELFM